MKHVFGGWAWGRKDVNYGIGKCKVCGAHFHVGNYEGCTGKPESVSASLDIPRKNRKSGKKPVSNSLRNRAGEIRG